MKNISKYLGLLLAGSHLFFASKALTEEDIIQQALSLLESRIAQQQESCIDPIASGFSSYAIFMINKAIQEHSLDQENVRALLLEKLEKKKKYYQERIGQYNYSALGKAGGLFLLGIICLYATWVLIGRELAPLDNEFNAKVAELAEYGITVREERWGNRHEIIIERDLRIPVIAEQLIKQIKPDLIKIREKKFIHNKPSLPTMITMTGIVASFWASWEFAKQGFWPNYKKRFEAYSQLVEMAKSELLV